MRPDDTDSKVLAECGRRFRRWAEDQTELPEIEIPERIPPRRRDNWRPLLRLADRAGGDWPRQAREAAIALEG
jgi:hypothetical protein